MSFVRYPLYASLVVDGARHDALEFSAAGLSLAQPVVEAAGLQHLRRGDECAITLRVGGAGWREEYDVVLRLAARGPVHAGFAFVALPPPARQVLARRSAGRDGAEAPWGENDAKEVFSGSAGMPAPFAFARLAEPEEPPRRCILSVSAAVFAVTRSRRCASPEAGAEDAPPLRTAASGSHPASTAFVYTVALAAVLLLSALVVFG